MKEKGIKPMPINRSKVVYFKAILSLVKVDSDKNRIFIAYFMSILQRSKSLPLLSKGNRDKTAYFITVIEEH